MSTPLPEPTPETLANLDRLLAVNGIERRVIAGKLRINPTRGELSEADLAFLRHYAEPLAEWLSNPPQPVAISTPQVIGEGCPECGSVEADHVFRTGPAGELLSRCVPCGCTWDWCDPSRVTLRSGRATNGAADEVEA